MTKQPIGMTKTKRLATVPDRIVVKRVVKCTVMTDLQKGYRRGNPNVVSLKFALF